MNLNLNIQFKRLELNTHLICTKHSFVSAISHAWTILKLLIFKKFNLFRNASSVVFIVSISVCEFSEMNFIYSVLVFAPNASATVSPLCF